MNSLNASTQPFRFCVFLTIALGTPTAAQAYVEASGVSAGSVDAVLMMILLGSFRMVGWIAKRVDRRLQKQAAFSADY